MCSVVPLPQPKHRALPILHILLLLFIFINTLLCHRYPPHWLLLHIALLFDSICLHTSVTQKSYCKKKKIIYIYNLIWNCNPWALCEAICKFRVTGLVMHMDQRIWHLQQKSLTLQELTQSQSDETKPVRLPGLCTTWSCGGGSPGEKAGKRRVAKQTNENTDKITPPNHKRQEGTSPNLTKPCSRQCPF